jgi:hypothetical protein
MSYRVKDELRRRRVSVVVVEKWMVDVLGRESEEGENGGLELCKLVVCLNKNCNIHIYSEGRMKKSLVEEGIQKSKDLGGSARQCHVARKICLESEGCIFGRVLFGLPRTWSP